MTDPIPREVGIREWCVRHASTTPEDLQNAIAALGITRREFGLSLGISQDRLRRMLDGRAPIPLMVGLACLAMRLRPS
jgi:hypothetical protein